MLNQTSFLQSNYTTKFETHITFNTVQFPSIHPPSQTLSKTNRRLSHLSSKASSVSTTIAPNNGRVRPTIVAFAPRRPTTVPFTPQQPLNGQPTIPLSKNSEETT